MKYSIAVLAALTLSHSASAEEERGVPREVAVILAHPDDELVMAPAIARAAREGANVTFIYATSGDQGPGVSGMEKGAALAEVRKAEANCSAQALGVRTVLFLDHGDGTLTDRPQDFESPARKLANDLGTILREHPYDVILTWGPDGGYGHGDHRIVSVVVTQLVQASPASGAELFYPGIPAGSLPPIPQMQDWAVTDPSRLPVSYAYNAQDLASARAATQCHATQFSAEERAQMPDLFHATVWQGSVHFRRAFDRGGAESVPTGE